MIKHILLITFHKEIGFPHVSFRQFKVSIQVEYDDSMCIDFFFVSTICTIN